MVKFYNNQLYLAPYFGKSVFCIDIARSDLQKFLSFKMRSLTGFTPLENTPSFRTESLTGFTDDENYRIYDFELTPFALYLNNGRALEKFYFASGTKETIYKTEDISSFIITPSEEIILADHGRYELIFLDFKNDVKFKKSNINIVDMQFDNDIIYTLTKRNIITYDEYGNIIQEIPVPEKMNQLFVDSTNVYLFTSDKNYFYQYKDDWKKVALPMRIIGLAINNGQFIILDNDGTNLYIYNRSDF